MRRQIGREKSLQKWEDVSKSSLRKGTASGNCFVEYLVLSNLLWISDESVMEGNKELMEQTRESLEDLRKYVEANVHPDKLK